MTNQPFTIAPTQPLEDRVAAIELLLQQLLFVLDATGAMNADALSRWIDTARSRMLAVGSAPPGHVAALAQLQDFVAQ